MQYEINGTIIQTLALNLSAGDVIYSQTNSMAWMSDGIRMDTHTGGGILEGLKRRDRKSTRLNSSHSQQSRMPSSA